MQAAPILAAQPLAAQPLAARVGEWTLAAAEAGYAAIGRNYPSA
jgi:hypothetical protein